MDWTKILTVIQVISGILMAAGILMQNRGASLGEAFGGSGALFGTRRGPEKVLYIATIVFAVLFVSMSLLVLFIG